jgi:hypothetical protein
LKRGRILWVNPQLTQRSGVTMRELRFRRFVWMRYGGMVALGGGWVNVARWLAELERDRGRQLSSEELGELLSDECRREYFYALLAQGGTVMVVDAA